MICKNCKSMNWNCDCSIRVVTALLEYLDLETKFKNLLPHFLYSVQVYSLAILYILNCCFLFAHWLSILLNTV